MLQIPLLVYLGSSWFLNLVVALLCVQYMCVKGTTGPHQLKKWFSIIGGGELEFVVQDMLITYVNLSILSIVLMK